MGRHEPVPEERMRRARFVRLHLIAALFALLSRTGGAEEPEAEAPSLWARPQLRAPRPPPGPGAWVASGLRL